LAAGSWTAEGDTLRNAGEAADPEPWLRLAVMPAGNYAIEAEIRVNGILERFCDQSFGLAAGAERGRIIGAGIHFPCAGAPSQARLTDVSEWRDGYHSDPVFAEAAFDPGRDWRTYRFELRGASQRLVIDGVGILLGTVDPPSQPAGFMETGIWSQGVDIDIRQIDIVRLPDS
jgi:hypothetical protein